MIVESLDPSKPLGKAIQSYVNQHWWRGFSLGFTSGIIYSYGLVLLIEYWHKKKL
jgi:hypothetical protein